MANYVFFAIFYCYCFIYSIYSINAFILVLHMVTFLFLYLITTDRFTAL